MSGQHPVIQQDINKWKLLPNELVNNILAYHMVPNNKLNVNIQSPKYPGFHTEHIPYRLNLLYRASRDGSTVAAFHEKCDNKGATITTQDSFVFSFTNRTDLRRAKYNYNNHNFYTKIDVPTSYDFVINVEDFELDDIAFYKLSIE
ncbi:hypothetical protein C1645_834041 [Glomus cerebriforme]|uniref:Uncharacterized protein n=1 Tax=Glomus cerebriforme TaxID=658196 RepID=A0A397SCR0_9GLOM|nr:hypothetical protein C1645_834041 [Glomus cerebriforme]